MWENTLKRNLVWMLTRLSNIYYKNYMGTKAKKPRAMRSRKSGLKTAKLIKNNQEILNKIK